MEHYSGIYFVLANLPIWATAMILFFATLGAMHAGREYFEGLPYQVSYSAMLGDALLFGVILIAAGILQKGGVVIPEELQGPNIHAMIFVVCICIGGLASILTLKGRDGHLMDIYHDIVIAPFILYSITLLPIIWNNGSNTEQQATIFAIFMWLELVIFDVKTDRMNQRRWLKNRGVLLK